MKSKRTLTIAMLLASVQFLSAMHKDTKFFLEYTKKITIREKRKKVSIKVPITRDALNQSKKLKDFVEREGTDKKYYNKKNY